MVCDALDEDALASALRRLGASGAEAMGACARETAERFGLDAMAQKLVALYRDLARRAGPEAIIRRCFSSAIREAAPVRHEFASPASSGSCTCA